MKDLTFNPYDYLGYLIIGLVALIGCQAVFGAPHILGRHFRAADLTGLVASAVIAGRFIGKPAKFFMEDIAVGKLMLPPGEVLWAQRRRPVLARLLPGYYAPLEASLQQRVTSKVVAEGAPALGGEELLQHIRSHERIRADSALTARLQAFLKRSGFARNLSFVAGAFGVTVLLVSPFQADGARTLLALFAVIAAGMLFVRFIKLYRRHAMELFEGYASLS